MAGRGGKPSLKERRKKALYIKISIIGALFIGLVGGIAYGTRLPQVTVQSVQVTGLDENKATEVVQRVLHGSYGLVIPKKFVYLLPHTSITQALLSAFPNAGTVRVVRVGTSLQISAQERVSVALWCNDACYQMDSDGFIFAPALSTTTLVSFRGVIDGGPIGATFQKGNFQKLYVLVNDLEKASGKRVSRVTVDGHDIFITIDTGGEIRVAFQQDRDTLLASVASVFGSERFQSRASFQYADFRFNPNRAVVKFNDR